MGSDSTKKEIPEIHTLEKSELMPPEFLEDQKWALEHYAELRRNYADMWVAISTEPVIDAKNGVELHKSIWIYNDMGHLEYRK